MNTSPQGSPEIVGLSGGGVPLHSGRPTRRLRKDTVAGWGFLAPAIAILCLVFVYPMIKLVDFSLHSSSGSWVGTANYHALFNDPVFQAAIKHNALLLLLIPILVVASVVIAALLYDQIAGWRVYRVVLFLPYMIPVVVAGLLFGVLLQSHGMINDILGAIGLGFLRQNWLGDPSTALPSVGGVILWRELGLGIVLFLARLTQLPRDTFEAAKVDGAGWWRTLIYVTIPQLRSLIAFYVAVLIIAMLSWVFNYVFVLTRGGPGLSTYVTEYYIYDRAFGYNEIGIASAAAVVLVAVVLVGITAYLAFMARRDVRG